MMNKSVSLVVTDCYKTCHVDGQLDELLASLAALGAVSIYSHGFIVFCLLCGDK